MSTDATASTSTSTHDVATCDLATCMSSNPGPDSSAFLEHLKYVAKPLTETSGPYSLLRSVFGLPSGLEIAKARLQSLVDAAGSAVQATSFEDPSIHMKRVRFGVAEALQDSTNPDKWLRSGLFAIKLRRLKEAEWHSEHPDRRSIDRSTLREANEEMAGFYHAGMALSREFIEAEKRRWSSTWSSWIPLPTILRRSWVDDEA